MPIVKVAPYDDATLPDLVLACQRLPRKGEEVLTYTIPVLENGFYDVTLLFAERNPAKVARRTFNVLFDDSIVLKHFDVLREAGRYYQLVGRTIAV